MEKWFNEQIITRFDIIESAHQKPKGVLMQIRGKFGHAGKITENGRYYSRAIMAREVDRLQSKITERALVGEADHPNMLQGGGSSITRSAFAITGLMLNDDGEIMGEADVVDTAAGRDFAALIRAGVQVGISSRGKGTSTQVKLTSTHPDYEINKSWDGKVFESVNEDFSLRTFDSVIGQAVEDAYVGDYRESKQEEDMDLEKILKDADLMKKILESEEAKKLIGELVEAAKKETEEELNKQFENDVKEAVMAYVDSEDFDSKFVVKTEDKDADKKDLEEVKCPECDGAIPKGAKFCPGCGSRVQQAKKEQNQDEKDAEIARLKEENEKIAKRMEQLEAKDKDREDKAQVESIVNDSLKDQLAFVVDHVKKDLAETVLTPKNAQSFVERRIAHYKSMDEALGGVFRNMNASGDGKFIPSDPDNDNKNENKEESKSPDLMILESIF